MTKFWSAFIKNVSDSQVFVWRLQVSHILAAVLTNLRIKPVYDPTFTSVWDECNCAVPGGSRVKNSPANSGDTGDSGDVVWSLSQEDPLEEGMAAHSSILAWRIPWTEEPGGLQSIGVKASDTAEALGSTQCSSPWEVLDFLFYQQGAACWYEVHCGISYWLIT